MFPPALLLAHKTDLLLDDWTDAEVVAAAGTIVRSLAACAEAALRNGDRGWLGEYAWFVERWRRVQPHG